MKKKIKIIDILCYISLGDYDKLPKKVKALDEIWIYDEIAECHKNKDCVRLYKRLDEFYTLPEWLNFEIEILDEEDEFEDIEEIVHEYIYGLNENEEIIDDRVCRFEDKINTLIKNQKKILERLNILDNN